VKITVPDRGRDQQYPDHGRPDAQREKVGLPPEGEDEPSPDGDGDA
jgi:hypothetical protein